MIVRRSATTTARRGATTRTTTTVAFVAYYSCYLSFIIAVAGLVVASAGGRLPGWSFLGQGASAQPQQRRECSNDHSPHHANTATATTTCLKARQGLSPFFSSSSSLSNDNVCSSKELVNDKATSRLEEAEQQLLFFLKESGGGRNEDEFHIHGWRWHTMSLIREASRLARTAQKLKSLALRKAQQAASTNVVVVVGNKDDDDWSDLCKAADYVVNFNMRGLHKIESTLFFPWARQRITSQLLLSTATTTTSSTAAARGQEQQQQQQQQSQHQVVAAAFGTVMDHLESQRKTVEQLGVQLNGLVSSSKSKKKNPKKSDGLLHDDDYDGTTLLLDRVASTSSAISQYMQNMLELEETLLVPVVARLVSSSEQRAFNNKVIWNLGVLDSRLHLVGMHQAVYSSSSSSLSCGSTNTALSNKNENQKKMKKEQRLFNQVIPSIPQRMIPRWKRLMYDPQVAIFQRILNDE